MDHYHWRTGTGHLDREGRRYACSILHPFSFKGGPSVRKWSTSRRRNRMPAD
jgi:hypothetical protein